MRTVVRIMKWLLGVLALAVLGLATWLIAAPPELIRVGAGYSAKIVCSNVFVAGREPQQVLGDDVQAPGHPLLRLMKITVDADARQVTAGLFGVFGSRKAVARDGLGCTVLPDATVSEPAGPLPTPVAWPTAPADVLWPQGTATKPSMNPAIARILDNTELTGPGMRAVVVVRNGRIEGERYGRGFSAATPLLGWSMTKTVNAALLGTTIKSGRLTLDRKGLFDAWKADGRAAIAVSDLTAMSSGLAFNEGYGDVSDVTRMLYLEPDMTAFSAAKSLQADIGERLQLFQRLGSDAVAAVAGRGGRRQDRSRLAAQIAVCTARHGKRRDGDRRGRHLCRLVLSLRHGARLGAFRPVPVAGWRMGRNGGPAAGFRRLDARAGACLEGRLWQGTALAKGSGRPESRRRNSACPPTSSGLSAMTDRPSRSFRQSGWSWCAWA